MSPFMDISSATFTYVRRVVVLMYFISKVRFDGFDTRI
jgi:hypothetical protein